MKITSLFEGFSPVLYHFTEFPAAKKILLSNKLGKMAGATNSFSRSITGNYQRENRLIGVIFEIDGVKLQQRHRGGPVGRENFDPDEGEPDFLGKGPQLEDRHVGIIDNFSKYITRAIITIPLEYFDSSDTDEFEVPYKETMKDAQKVLSLLKSLRIPTVAVASERDLFNRKYLPPENVIRAGIRATQDIVIDKDKIQGAVDFDAFLSEMIEGDKFMFRSPSKDDIENFLVAYKRWGSNPNVKTELQTLTRAYKSLGVQVRKVSDLISMMPAYHEAMEAKFA